MPNYTTGLPDITKLQNSLLQSKIQETDRPLFQTIYLLIKWVNDYQKVVNAALGGFTPGSSILNNQAYLTAFDNTPLLPNSKMLVAGANISFDDSVAGRRTINATGGSSIGIDHVIMSDGATPIPSPIDDGFGNFIYVAYTP